MKPLKRCRRNQIEEFTSGPLDLSFLPEEIVDEIILRLPIKPLFRFKTVSKRWKSLISSPKFAESHQQRSISSPESWRLLAWVYPYTDTWSVNNWCKGFKELSAHDPDEEDELASINNHLFFVSFPDKSEHDILASSNGLVLSFIMAYKLFDDPDVNLWVSNPLTKLSVQLPNSTLPARRACSVIGFAARSTSYRAVLIERNAHRNPRPVYEPAETTVEIFSSESGVWTASRVPDCPGELLNGDAMRGIAHRGVLYWLCWHSGNLIAFDPFAIAGRFEVIPLPNPNNYKNWANLICIGGDQDSLKFCERHWDELRVWRLGETREWCLELECLLPSWYDAGLLRGCTMLQVAPNRELVPAHGFKEIPVHVELRPWTSPSYVDA